MVQEEIAGSNPRVLTGTRCGERSTQYGAAFLDGLEQIGGFGGKADRLNAYLFATGNPD